MGSGTVNMRNIERTLALLERVAVGPPLTQAQLADDLDLSRSTASDLLRDLQKLGYVSLRERSYSPGVRLLSLLVRSRQATSLSAAVRPTLQALSEAVGETAIFVTSVADAKGLQVMSVDEVQSPHELRYVAQLGRPYDAATTMAGQVMLAFGEDTAGVLKASQRAAIRERGYTLTASDPRGATIIAAPVLDAAGQAVGAITVIGPASRIADPEGMILGPLREAVARLGASPSEKD